MIQNYRMILQYDGTRYNGWQRQGNTGNTIQGKLEDIFSRYFDQPIELQASGRTDAGVHSLGQTVSFKVDYGKYGRNGNMDNTKSIDNTCNTEVLQEELNSYLPEDIKITELSEVDIRFHARLNAVEKEYRYYISLDRKKDVFARKYMMSLEEPDKLDIESMRRASRLMLGEHDFQGFSDNRSNKSTVRTITSIDFNIKGHENFGGKYLEISFCGNGFLYHTVRLLVGTLLAIGMGKAKEDIVEEIFDSRNRKIVPFMAPAEGLFLYKVKYTRDYLGL